MISTDGERVKPNIAVSRHDERARVTYLHGRAGTRPVRTLVVGTIVESFAANRLTLELDGRSKSIHLSRVEQLIVLAETAAVSTD
jgi:hypothetical protein